MNIEFTISNGNCHIVNSYKIKNEKVMREFVEQHLTQPPFNKRSVRSYVNEWRAHNLLYELGLFVSHTKDVDLDVGDKRGFLYAILAFFY